MLYQNPIDKKLVQRVAKQFPFNHKHSEHGMGHWLRVINNGIQLAQNSPLIDIDVVFWFGLFHDCCRLNEHNDPHHGKRACHLIEQLHDHLPLSNTQLEQLKEACSIHTKHFVHDDPTIAACLDADRLDLPRVNVDVNPAYLSLEAAKCPKLIAKCTQKARSWAIDEELALQLGVALLFDIEEHILDFFDKYALDNSTRGINE
ncbi:hypothetical protein [Thaumasiovibrio sp. DFM-14]|uniref:hypothetical protein n=1 Tax=Thaumasiovibrio sp. DFM-14 TaxID=3384792 RepID=UPI0039A13B82